MLRRILGGLVAGTSLITAACGDSTGAEAGSLSLMLTDAPGDFTRAWITIERIDLVGDGDPVVLRETALTTELLTLANDVAEIVDDEPVPGGTYTQLRFIIPEACIRVEQDDGSEQVYASGGFDNCGAPDGSLQLPSLAQTGIKVNLPGGSLEVDGDARVLLVDFDVSQSFGQEAGGSGMWVMHPVINADDISLSSSITVELAVADAVDLSGLGSSLADFQARLSTEAAPRAFTDGDGDGVFTASFDYLLPGQAYAVSVVLREGVSYGFTLDPTSPQNVALESAQVATVAFVVTSAAQLP